MSSPSRAALSPRRRPQPRPGARRQLGAGVALFVAVGLLAGACSTGASKTATTPVNRASVAVAGVATIVTGLQEDLQRLGYNPGPISGTFSPTTTDALIRFQTDNGLSERGALGPATARQLAAKLPGASEAVRALKSALTDVGLYSGTIDGQYGDDLLAAVQALQRQASIPADGQYGNQTALALDQLYIQKVPGAQTNVAVTSTSTSEQATTSTTDPDNLMQLGRTSAKVKALQDRLVALGYRPGAADGFFGAGTASAVLAFQKREGLPRDGIAGPVVQAAVLAPKGAGPHQGLPVPRIEVDLARQIAFIVLAGGAVTTVNVSTGSGMHYEDPTTHATDTAYTPVGSFHVEREINADVKAPLGTLHRPLYFFQGWAVHGAASVPPYPASHGCVRVSDADSDWLFPQIPVGTAVVIYDATGKSPAPGQAPAGATPGY